MFFLTLRFGSRIKEPDGADVPKKIHIRPTWPLCRQWCHQWRHMEWYHITILCFMDHQLKWYPVRFSTRGIQLERLYIIPHPVIISVHQVNQCLWRLGQILHQRPLRHRPRHQVIPKTRTSNLHMDKLRRHTNIDCHIFRHICHSLIHMECVRHITVEQFLYFL